MLRSFSLASSLTLAFSCASAPEVAPKPAAPRATPPSGAVQVGIVCHYDELRGVLWNPAAVPRTCHIDEHGPYSLGPLELSHVGAAPLSSIEEHPAVHCVDTPADIEARVAVEVPRLADPDPAVREEAAKVLGGLGPRAHSAVPALAARAKVETDDGPLYHVVTGLIDLLGPDAVPLLVDALDARSDKAGRARIAEQTVGLGAAVAPHLTPRLSAPNVAEAFSTSDVIRIDLDAGRRLLVARHEADGRVDAKALGVYLAKRPHDTEIARAAIDALASSDAKTRYWLVEALAHLRSPAAVAALVGALSDPDRTVVYKTAEAIGVLARAEPSLMSAAVADAVAALIPTDDHSRLWYATMTLGRIGIDTARVREALSRAASSEDLRIRIIAAASRAQLEGRLLDVEVMREGIASPEGRVRGLAFARIEELGPLAAPLVDAFAAALVDALAARSVEGTDTPPMSLWADRLTEVLLAIGPVSHDALKGVAVSRPRVTLTTWLEVVDALGEEAAAPLLRELAALGCQYRSDYYTGVEASIVRLRLGGASWVDRARLVDGLARPYGASLARSLIPFAPRLGLDEAERAAIIWLAEHHVDAHARASLARLAHALR